MADLSQEERDLLERSTKKAKAVDETMQAKAQGFKDHHSSRADTMEIEGESQTSKRTFKESLMGYDLEKRNHDRRFNNKDDTASDDEDEQQEDDDPLCPVIKVSREEKIRLRRPWKRTLILKVWGRAVGYNYLLRRLNMIWKPKATMEVVAIDNGYFLAKFETEEDYKFAKFEGPWMVLGHYLIVKEWTHDFDPFTDTTEKMLVWVRFPCIPIEYYDSDFLMRLGERIGNPIKVDDATGAAARGFFARMCVEVDITKPLLPKFILRNKVRKIEYEGVHLICFNCGVYGHHQEKCPQLTMKNGIDGNDDMHGRKEGDNQWSNQTSSDHAEDMERQGLDDEEKSFGPWMLATSRGRRGGRGLGRGESTRKDKDQPGRNRTGGSRFRALDSNGNDNGPETPGERPIENGWNRVGQNTLPSRGKRSNVQLPKVIPETNTMNDSGATTPSGKRGNGVHRDLVIGRKKPNQAATEHEHTVVSSFDGGETITRTTFINEAEDHMLLGVTEFGSLEHHDDPPISQDAMNVDITLEDDRNFALKGEFPVGPTIDKMTS